MDRDRRMDDGKTADTGHPGPGDRVGLGRVVEDHAAATAGRPALDDVEEASDESFPASDPPAFAPGRPALQREEPTAPELPRPRDVP